jgi:hypothetical protein
MVNHKITGLLISAFLLLVLTIIHLIIYIAFLNSPIPEAVCTVGAECPSWMIPNNAMIYLILAVLEFVCLFSSMVFIYTPYNMLRANQVTPRQIAIRAALANISTSGLFPLWFISSLLSVASTRGYDAVYTENAEYRMYLGAVAVFILFDLGYIFLVAGVNQIWVTRAKSARELAKFRAAVIIIAIRLTISIVFLFIQFFVDYVGGNATGSAMTVASYAAFTMILIMMLYKIYMVQLLVRKSIETKKDFFAVEAGRFNIVDESGWL